TPSAWSCPRASRPASSCCSTGSSIGSFLARICGPRSPTSSTIANGVRRVIRVEGFLVSLMSLLKQLFSGSKKDSLPIVNVHKRFELLGRTGQGSMSKVWRARDKSLGRMVCLKLLDKEKTAKFEARFQIGHKPKEGAICID